METAQIQIGQHLFQVWLARDPQQRHLGLMHVTAEELAPITQGPDQKHPTIYRGMLFVFPYEQQLSFWMHNTITPLDIAYIRADGQIVRTCSMAPLETRSYPSVEPARYALEVPAGLFAQLGIVRGTRVEIPEYVLKGAR